MLLLSRLILFFYWKFMNESRGVSLFFFLILSPHHHVHVHNSCHDGAREKIASCWKCRFLELELAPDALSCWSQKLCVHPISKKYGQATKEQEQASEIMMRWSWNAHHHIINFLLDFCTALPAVSTREEIALALQKAKIRWKSVCNRYFALLLFC